MFKLTLKLALATTVLGFTAFAAQSAEAQYADVSPVLMIESGPSDNPEYRRMIFVKYLSGNRVGVNYKAYNRTEFAQTPNMTPREVVSACSNGAATSFSDIKAFEREEARRMRRGEAPKLTRFCIKNVQNWEGGGRTRYLDPIFSGMPYAASLNN